MFIDFTGVCSGIGCNRADFLLTSFGIAPTYISNTVIVYLQFGPKCLFLFWILNISLPHSIYYNILYCIMLSITLFAWEWNAMVLSLVQFLASPFFGMEYLMEGEEDSNGCHSCRVAMEVTAAWLTYQWKTRRSQCQVGPQWSAFMLGKLTEQSSKKHKKTKPLVAAHGRCCKSIPLVLHHLKQLPQWS